MTCSMGPVPVHLYLILVFSTLDFVLRPNFDHKFSHKLAELLKLITAKFQRQKVVCSRQTSGHVRKLIRKLYIEVLHMERIKTYQNVFQILLLKQQRRRRRLFSTRICSLKWALKTVIWPAESGQLVKGDIYQGRIQVEGIFLLCGSEDYFQRPNRLVGQGLTFS